MSDINSYVLYDSELDVFLVHDSGDTGRKWSGNFDHDNIILFNIDGDGPMTDEDYSYLNNLARFDGYILVPITGVTISATVGSEIEQEFKLNWNGMERLEDIML